MSAGGAGDPAGPLVLGYAQLLGAAPVFTCFGWHARASTGREPAHGTLRIRH